MTTPPLFAVPAALFLIAAAATAAGPPPHQASVPLPERLEDELRIHFYNIGAGTCTLVECPGPDARPIIVDCGKLNGGQGEHAITDVALKARIRTALAGRSPDVVLSHSDTDHVSLVPLALEDVPVSAIWQGDNPEDYPEAVQAWVNEQQRQGTAIHRHFRPNWHSAARPIANGLDCGMASSHVLTVNSGRDANANSLVLLLKHGDFSAILTGDATGVTEDAAIANYQGDLAATVITASHHGASSKGSNSPEWAAATEPKVAVYSAGTLFGHPRCAVTERLDDTLATVPTHDAICGESSDHHAEYQTQRAEYMTRVNGAIPITTDGQSQLRLDCEVGPGCSAVQVPF